VAPRCSPGQSPDVRSLEPLGAAGASFNGISQASSEDRRSAGYAPVGRTSVAVAVVAAACARAVAVSRAVSIATITVVAAEPVSGRETKANAKGAITQAPSVSATLIAAAAIPTGKPTTCEAASGKPTTGATEPATAKATATVEATAATEATGVSRRGNEGEGCEDSRRCESKSLHFEIPKAAERIIDRLSGVHPILTGQVA
jgi:hypothetical protein